MKVEFLSYPLEKKIPAYGKFRQEIPVISRKSIKKGDSCNVSALRIENHWGTHVDCPNHFFAKGKKVADYPASFWVFKHPQIVELSLRPSELVTAEKLKGHIDKRTDFLILKSGWGKYRSKSVYSLRNPGIHPGAAAWLRKYFHSLRALGIDWISVSPYADRETGRKTHREFLGNRPDSRPVLLIEDMKVPAVRGKLFKVTALPLVVKNVDSAPCTLIGEYNG